jgi:predicted membrane channel-forming protein YqfA (hemolysin III family)
MLLTLIVTLVVIAVILYIVETLIPMDRRIKMVIYVLIGIYVVLFLLAALGINVPILGGLMK